MLKLPTTLNQNFDNLLLNNSFSDKDRSVYKKWLRFYWDFCHKYRHDVFHSGSLLLFLQKLQDKNQSVQQQNQAKHSVSLFLEMHTASEQQVIKDGNISMPAQHKMNPDQTISSHGKHPDGHSSAVQNAKGLDSSPQPGSNSFTADHSSEDTGASWVFVFDQLVNEHKFGITLLKRSRLTEGIYVSFKPLPKAKIAGNFCNRM